jgi:hypothetical protein
MKQKDFYTPLLGNDGRLFLELDAIVAEFVRFVRTVGLDDDDEASRVYEVVEGVIYRYAIATRVKMRALDRADTATQMTAADAYYGAWWNIKLMLRDFDIPAAEIATALDKVEVATGLHKALHPKATGVTA